MMTPIDYKYQNPSGFGCLLQRYRYFNPPWDTKFKLKKKRKTNWTVEVVVK